MQRFYFINAMLIIHVHVERKTSQTCFLKILTLIIKLMVEVNPSKFSNTELIREKGSLLTQVLISHINSLYTGVSRFPLDISTTLLLKNFIEQNELHPILIRKYRELEKKIEMLVY